MLYLTQPSPAVETFLPSARGRSSISKSDFDSLSHKGSIMQINESPKDGDIPMEPTFDRDKILIFFNQTYPIGKRRSGKSETGSTH